MKKLSFTFEETGHSKIMSYDTQKGNPIYDSLKKEYINILKNRTFKFDTDRVDARRTIVCIEANKLTAQQLEQLIEQNRVMEDLLKTCK